MYSVIVMVYFARLITGVGGITQMYKQEGTVKGKCSFSFLLAFSPLGF